jgi:hypothetical protein
MTLTRTGSSPDSVWRAVFLEGYRLEFLDEWWAKP